MAIEIRELVLMTAIAQEGSNGKSAGAPQATNNSVSSNEEIINTCIEKVLEILKDKNER